MARTGETASAAARARRAVAAWAMARLVNPLVRALLRSPLHDLLSGRVLLLRFTGARTGAERSTPVDYLEREGELRLLSRRSRRWWRNLRGGAHVGLRLRGETRDAWAEPLDLSPAEAREAVTAFYAAAGRSPPAARAAELAREAVVVRVRLLAPAKVAPPLRGGALWRRWTLLVTAGEALGFALPTVAAAATSGLPALAAAPALLLAGAGEGALLGLAQAAALRPALPVPTAAWVRATTLGAVIAWAIGLLPSLLGERVDGWPPAALVALALPLGLALLLAMGALQSRVLRAFVPRAGAWVPAVALAWLCGLLVFGAVATLLWHEGQALAVTIAVGLLGGVLMAATVAALSGAALVRLLDAPRWR